jgi:hypothetical protein
MPRREVMKRHTPKKERWDPALLAKVIGDDRARRELLWLRAKEKEDERSVRDLERVDPDLLDRLRSAGCDLEDHAAEHPRDRRERFARLWHERFDWHIQTLDRRRHG